LRFRNLEIALQPRWRSWIFFLVVSLGAVLLGGAALRTAFIAMLGESVQEETLQRAVALDPANPELHHRLGMVLCDSFGEADRIEGLKHLRRATELNPLAARYWSDLGWVCEVSDDTACATQAVERAVTLSPMTPQLHWVAANTLLRTGQRDAAMAEFRRLLELDPTYAPATFHICLGSLGDPQLILQRVLPPGRDPRLKLAYLNFLITNGLADQAHQVWVDTVAAGIPFPLSLASPYIDNLLELGRGQEAQSAWQDLERLGVVSKPTTDEGGNLVFNGDFEQTPVNAGLDWRNQPGPSIALDFSDPAAHTGKLCFRLDFTVSRNEEYKPLYQLVPVASDQAYLLTAYVRSQDITSDSGPRLQVLDPVHSRGPQVVSETTVGTTPWHQISLKFCAGPDTKIVRLSLIRERGRTFPTEITGTFWLDTVVLKALGPANERACGALDH
jgi:tetratricopeptide (TPR) repeat protein